jgi:excisionase family DNA binding protein
MRELLGLQAAGKLLGISPHTLRSWARRGLVIPARLGRRVLFDPADLEAFVEANKVRGGSRAEQGPTKGPTRPHRGTALKRGT